MQVLINDPTPVEPSSIIEMVLPPANNDKKINRLKASVSSSANTEIFCADLTAQNLSTLGQDRLTVQGVIEDMTTMRVSIEFTALPDTSAS